MKKTILLETSIKREETVFFLTKNEKGILPFVG